MLGLTPRIEISRNIKYFYVAVLRRNFHNDPWNVLFFGTDQFAIKPLECLHSLKINSNLVNNVEVICPPEKRRVKDIKKQSKIPTVRQFAETHRVTIHDWPLDRKNLDFLSRFNLGIVISFGHIIPSWIINNLTCGAINIHPSLLPKWRGPSPIIHTLLNGDSHTGVSIIEVSPKKFDTGKILLQKEVQIAPNKTYEDLADDLSTLSVDMLLEVLTNFMEYNKNAVEQDEKKVTQAPKVSKEMGYVKWNEFTCEYIERLWHVIGDRFGLKCKWNEQVVKLETLVETRTLLSGAPSNAKNGQPFYDNSKNILYIKCKDGWLGWTSLKLQYRKSITAKEFYNGYLVDRETSNITLSIFNDMI